MPHDFPTCMTTGAESLIDILAMVEPSQRAAVITFHPDDPIRHVLHSNAAAVDLIPMLRSLLLRLESGALRMPVNGGVGWVDFDLGEEGW